MSEISNAYLYVAVVRCTEKRVHFCRTWIHVHVQSVAEALVKTKIPIENTGVMRPAKLQACHSRTVRFS